MKGDDTQGRAHLAAGDPSPVHLAHELVHKAQQGDVIRVGFGSHSHLQNMLYERSESKSVQMVHAYKSRVRMAAPHKQQRQHLDLRHEVMQRLLLRHLTVKLPHSRRSVQDGA